MKNVQKTKQRNRGASLTILALTVCALSSAYAQSFQITNALFDPQRKFTLQFPSDTNSYFILDRNFAPTNVTNAVAMALGTMGGGQLVDKNAAVQAAFFRIRKVPLSSPLATAGDGIDDVYKLQHPNVFTDPLNPAYAGMDFDGDGVSNLREYQRGTDPANPASVNVNLYINSANGSDSNDGITPSATPWAMGTHGPMLTVQGAISVTVSHDTVVIAAGMYHNTLLDPGPRSITLSPQGSVTIQ
ncbi:MAG: hypothetical protein C5B50_26110 [Verrucomicrobia bacterium]|nr:MAG: hypothetical protein C5B50_26110 [Verrucomicrobiota bacterium]